MLPIINVDYNGAIQYYQQQKQLFLQYYKQMASEENSNVEDRFVSRMAEELNFESLDEEYSKALGLLKDLGEIYGDRARLKQLRMQAQQMANDNKLQGEMILEEITNELVSKEEFYELVRQSIASYGEGFCSFDVLKSAKSYVRALIQQRVINKGSHNPKIADRAKKMKGYYREGLAYRALSKILYSLGENPPVEIISQGAKNTDIDTLIKFNPQFFQTTIDETIGDSFIFGMQEKSWQDPWTKAGYFQSISDKAAVLYSVGTRTDLLAGLENKESWIAGVNYLGQTNNIKAALGEKNILYLTGTQFYFTAELITQMRMNAYYLAFVFSKDYVATSSITWQRAMDQVRWIQSIKKKI